MRRGRNGLRTERPSKALIVMMMAGLLVVSVGAGTAYGLNTHTTGHINHGLGDGTNNNYYVHPYSVVTDGHNVTNLKYTLRHSTGGGGSVQDRAQTCTCVHVHTNWDTTPNPECLYYSGHSAGGTGSHFLNFHYHYHDGFCG